MYMSTLSTALHLPPPISPSSAQIHYLFFNYCYMYYIYVYVFIYRSVDNNLLSPFIFVHTCM